MIWGSVWAAEEPGWVSYDMGLCLGSGGARLGQYMAQGVGRCVSAALRSRR